jgi:ferredoxin
MTGRQGQIRETAKRWLEGEEVKYIIGYEAGRGAETKVVFARKPGDADRLVWNTMCVNNLTLFLVEEMQRKLARGEEPDTRPVGIVVKPCDSKTIVELMKEHIVPRERVKIIGLTCEGVCDTKKLIGTESEPPAVTDATIAGKCTVCTHHNPLIADVVVGEAVPETITDDYSEVAELEAMSPEERWAFWVCYCEECVFDREKPYRWNEKSVQLPENTFYHLVRAMHLAGRCVDCGECERVCPVDIPIRKINRFLEKKAKERYGVEPGVDPEADSMFGTCDTADPEEFIW